MDAAVVSPLATAADAAVRLQGLGYDGCWTAEINHDPFLPLALAAEHTTSIDLGTSIAVAFAGGWHFAGTETEAASGHVEGAVLAGERVAQEIEAALTEEDERRARGEGEAKGSGANRADEL